MENFPDDLLLEVLSYVVAPGSGEMLIQRSHRLPLAASTSRRFLHATLANLDRFCPSSASPFLKGYVSQLELSRAWRGLHYRDMSTWRAPADLSALPPRAAFGASFYQARRSLIGGGIDPALIEGLHARAGARVAGLLVLDDARLASLPPFPALCELLLSHCTSLSCSSLVACIEACAPSLRVIELLLLPAVAAERYPTLRVDLPALRRLHVTSCGTFASALVEAASSPSCDAVLQDTVVFPPARRDPAVRLRTLSVAHALFDDRALERIVRPGCASGTLRSLDVALAHHLARPALSCASLVRVQFVACAMLGDGAVGAICRGCPSLARLVLRACPRLRCPAVAGAAIVELDVRRSSNLRPSFFGQAAAACPRLSALSADDTALGRSDAVESGALARLRYLSARRAGLDRGRLEVAAARGRLPALRLAELCDGLWRPAAA